MALKYMPIVHFDPFNWFILIRDIVPFAIGLAGGVLYWLRSRQAQSWPCAQGTVWQAEAKRPKEIEDRRRIYIWPWVGQFTYSYPANGEYYSGCHTVNALTERRAEQVVSGWKGRMLVVRYSPANPGISVVLKEDQTGGILGN